MLLETQYDKRKHFRADARFVVSYGRVQHDSIVDRDISQTKNISETGAAFTTSRPFEAKTNLMLQIKLPVVQESVQVFGTVLESREIRPHLVYYTRVTFSEIEAQKRQAIQQIVSHYTRK